MRKIVLGECDKFKSNDSWRFIDSDLRLNENSSLKNIPSLITIGNQLEDISKNYTAVKIGDVNYSAQTSATGNLKPRSDMSFDLLAEDKTYKSGEIVSLVLKPSNDINFLGTQFTIEFDAASLVFSGIESKILNISDNNFNITNAHNGVLTVSLDESGMKPLKSGNNLLSVNFTAVGNGTLSQNVKINSKLTQAEIYEAAGSSIEERPLTLRFNNDETDFSFEVFQNTPNPFSEKTTIGFTLPESDLTMLTVYDLTGKKVYQVSKDATKGYNEFEIDNNDLDVKGMLYYKLESGQYSEMKKMILIR